MNRHKTPKNRQEISRQVIIGSRETEYSPNGAAMRKRLADLWSGTDDDPEIRNNLQHMRPGDLFQAWLEYEGIIGYSSTIIERLRESGYIVEVPED